VLSVNSFDFWLVFLLVMMQLLIFALETLLQDEGFQLNTPSASQARIIATNMLMWLKVPANCYSVDKTCQQITLMLCNCIPQEQKPNWETMWKKSHATITASKFRSEAGAASYTSYSYTNILPIHY